MGSDKWHSLSANDVLARLNANRRGLDSAEALKRLAQFGRNEIARRKAISPARLLLKQFANFFIWALVGASVLAFIVSAVPGEEGRQLTGFFILGIVVLSVMLNFFQEYRAQHELLALNKLLATKARVLRDGAPVDIPAEEIVPGDVLLLSHGQRVPADARLLESYALAADESALTGESLPVLKNTAATDSAAALAERADMLFASTHLTSGTAEAVVVATGMRTEVGAIAGDLQDIAERPTPFQLEVKRMARQMTIIVIIAAVIVALFLIFALRESLVDVALDAVSLAVATIPESLPIVLTFALALSAHEMARRMVVVRRLSVVESLGSVDTICTDKTGTLTTNVMTVQRVSAGGHTYGLVPRGQMSEAAREVLRAGALCNDATISGGPMPDISGDPVDIALIRAAIEAGLDAEKEMARHPRLREIPFDPIVKMMTTVHRFGDGEMLVAKGAPGVILTRCTLWRTAEGRDDSLRAEDLRQIHDEIERLQEGGLYLIGLAIKTASPPRIIRSDEAGMTFLGVAAMMDPARPGSREAIARAKNAGIRVIMITGDNALTARAIGRQLGIGDRAVEARELESLAEADLVRRIKNTDIVARATPQIKQRVLKALQDDGHFVAMTGDGVNDATALKQSDVGVAMGLRGTDIAKESADMVLLDDNFATMVSGVEEGRRVFDNIRKFSNYLLSTTLGSLVVVLALSFSGYFPLTPKMLLWVNVVTDLIPASALAADPAVKAIMRRRPRRRDEPILNKAIYATIAGSVFRTLIAYVVIFRIGLWMGDVTYARTMLFTSIVLHAFTRVMVVRQLDSLSIFSNRALLASYAVAVCLQLLALYTPLRNIFGIIPLDLKAWMVMIIVVIASSISGIYMTRWILRLIPLWSQEASGNA